MNNDTKDETFITEEGDEVELTGRSALRFMDNKSERLHEVRFTNVHKSYEWVKYETLYKVE